MPEKIGILSSQRGYHVTALEASIRAVGWEPVFFHVARMTARIAGGQILQVRDDHLEECRAVLVRTIPAGSLEQIIFRMDALHCLEMLGVRVINSARAIERSVDKYYASFLLSGAGIPTPRTLVTEDFDSALAFCREMRDVILKPIFGSEGKGMVRVSDEETAYRVLRAWELNRYIYYIQEYLPHFQEDIRAFVIGDRVVAAMRRRGLGWKTNFAQGAQVEPVVLSGEMETLALKATHLIGLDYAGVDLMQSEDGRVYVIEVNSIPGWRGLHTATGRKISDLIVRYLKDQLG